MNKKILYIGNKLSQHNNNQSTIETLGNLLSSDFTVTYSSSKRNKFARILAMILQTFKAKFKQTNFVLIDTYSTWNFYYTLIISQLCRLLNLKYIPILHGGNLPYRLKNNPFLCDLIFKNSYHNVAPSKYLLEAFQKKYNSNTIYIPNTIEIEKYTFLNRNCTQPQLLWVRAFAKIYNPKMAIDVFAAIKGKYPNATLCMIGPDKENILDEYKEYAKNLNVEVLFTGKLSKQEWIQISKEYNIFINTTYFDNTPVSVIEAMALGLPVVSTNVGGIPFLIENNHNGIVVPDNSINDMVEAVENLCNYKEKYSNIAQNARNYVEKFDWQNIKPLWIDLLK